MRLRFLTFILLLLSLELVGAQDTTGLSWLVLDEGSTWSWEEIGDGPGRLYSIPNAPVNYRVLVLCSKKSSSYVLAFNTLLNVVESRLPGVTYYFFNYNKDDSLADQLVEYGRSINVDMILSMGSEAMIYASENLMYDDIPVVTCINKDPVLLGYVSDYTEGSQTAIAYTSVNIPMNITVEWIYKMRPELKSITILYDPEHSSVVASEVRPLQTFMEDAGVHVIEGSVAPGKNIEDRLGEKIRLTKTEMNRVDPGLENSLYWLTSSTNVFSYMDIVSREVGRVPVVSSVPNTVNSSTSSAMVAIGTDRRNSARLSGLYLVEILSGKSQPGDLPVGIVTPPDISINFQTTKRIGERMPFEIFENASFIYGYEGTMLRNFGKDIRINP